MRIGAFVFAGALLGVSACGGLLIVEEPRVEGSRLARCDDSSECDLGLVCGACDEHLCCVDSPGACGPMFPGGDCPLGQKCSNGVCVDSDTSWCDCQPDQGCDSGVCVDVDTGNQCSALNPDGVCREGHVCNGGSCVPCTENNSCSSGRPNGCCPGGAVCEAGRCYGEAEEVCSPTNTGGVCPAGQACNDQGFCEEVECSDAEPFGVCNPGLFCDHGDCVCIPCSLDNLGGCCGEQAFCSMEGYCIPDDSCRVDFDCESGRFCSVTQVCLTPPACADPADCTSDGEVCVDNLCTVGCTDDTPCDSGYHCNGTVCVVDTCDSLGCAGLNRECDASGAYAVCTTCVTGHHEDQGSSCVPDTCAEADCAAVNRECDESGPYAVCGGCLPGFNDVDGVCSNCQLTADCAEGFYCSAAKACTQDCDPSTQTTCDNGRRCSPYGRCVPELTDSEACAAGVTEGGVIEPVVMILVDQSGSMTTHYDVGSRWHDLEDVLFDDPGGVVKPLEDDIMFGLTLYTTGGGSCPRLRQEDYIDGQVIGPKLNNYADMAALYADQAPSGDTPTGDSINSVVTYLTSLTLDPPRPKYILLATDGEPDRCEELNPQRGQAESVVAARDAFNEGIRTFMLSVGSDVRDDHMQDVANAGAGCTVNPIYDDAPGCEDEALACWDLQDDVTGQPGNPWVVRCPDDSNGTPINHPFYKATSRQDLIDALNEIFGSVLSCVVGLNATPGAPPVTGNVYVDGEVISEGPPNGWMITGPDTLQFLGATCAAITDGQPHFIAVEINECDFPE